MRDLIFDIQRFCVYDGPGIRTTVFFKGCNMHCAWCHNPESFSTDAELLFRHEKCTSCGACTAVCPNGAHEIKADGTHIFDRAKCAACGKCAEVCPNDVLELSGREMTVEAVMKQIDKDAKYYRSSKGGVTFSGGEASLHFELLKKLLTACREKGYHTALENGLNLYVYCGNDLINIVDHDRCFPVLAIILCGIALAGMGLTIGGVASDNNILTAVGLGMVGFTALVSVCIAIAGAILTSGIGGITATAGLGSLGFMSAEIQETTGNGNWIIDTTGMSDGLYNTLLLSMAVIATLGTAASSVSSAFNIKSINGFGKYGDYYGMRFQTGTGKTRVLSFHTHGHKVAKGIKSIGEWLWQLQKCNTNSNRTSETIAKWIWRSLKRI